MMTLVREIAIVLIVAALTTGTDELPKGYKIVNPFICKPGSNFKLDCNDCMCSPVPGSVGMCTLMECGLKPDECIPGSYFSINEKLCLCPASGVKWDSNCFSKTK